ncbi:hypothetical protein [Acaryochloris marina]|uniref:Transposase n=1 Tax=Acaryochloris marina (strain MBIC 11017) TaxID=329726 RepID=A8ZKL7_ACAM1|nr:hypothetical protein [Acaryochloris marina]ABW31717.1 hypothetical protein AM1_A0214 [Acaryochloris marina MBIC11017]
MKTIEFPLYLDSSQQVKVTDWMDILKHVYNRGIALLEWRQFYNRLQKVREVDPEYNIPVQLNVNRLGGEWSMSCECRIKTRLDKSKSWDEANIEHRPACTLVKPHWLTVPLIAGFSPVDLRKSFARKRYKNLGDIPQVYVNDFIGLVVFKAWANYLDQTRPEIKRPRYKGKYARVNTIPCESFRSLVKIDFATDHLQLPGLGWISVPALSTRLKSVMDRQRLHMEQHPDHYPELAKKLIERNALLRVAHWLEQGVPMPEEVFGDIKKAIKHAEHAIEKTGNVSFAITKLRELAIKRELNQAINDLCTPGVFRICRKADKFYLQITVRSVVNQGNPRPEPIGLDMGLNLLCHTTNGVKVKHPDLSQLTNKINRLKQKQSKMKLGSQNWHRIQKKISLAEQRKTRAKRSRQHYIAGWLVDANQNMAIKKFSHKDVVARPLPRPSKKTEQYLKNGREEQRIINNQVREAALGQFTSFIQLKAADRENHVIEFIECDSSATPNEILETSSFHSGGPQSEKAQNLQRTREGGRVTTTTREESESNSSTTRRLKQAPLLVNPAQSPKPFKRLRRMPQAERKVL